MIVSTAMKPRANPIQLETRRTAMRRPRKDAALVRVEATSVNPIDGKFLWSSATILPKRSISRALVSAREDRQEGRCGCPHLTQGARLVRPPVGSFASWALDTRHGGRFHCRSKPFARELGQSDRTMVDLRHAPGGAPRLPYQDRATLIGRAARYARG